MDGNDPSGENDIDWNTDDELEISNYPVSSSSSLSLPGGEATVGSLEASCLAGPSNTMVRDFLGMGFSQKMISRAIEENGEGDADSILNTLLTYQAIENSPGQKQPIDPDIPKKQQTVDSDGCSSGYGSFVGDFSDIDSFSENEEFHASATDIHKIKKTPETVAKFQVLTGNFMTGVCRMAKAEIMDISSETNHNLLFLVDMEFTPEEAAIAIQRCGPDSSIDELVDFIGAARMAKAADAHFVDLPEVKPTAYLGSKRRKHLNYDLLKRKKVRGLNEEDETIRLPNPMIGFGTPGELCPAVNRPLPEAAIGPPYFYYENVALAPKGVWNTISRFLYDVEPEFVDSKYFCAAARKRGYVHNLPVVNRYPLVPLPPRTIHDALPMTRKWWPSWDTRTKLNCLQTCIASAKLSDRIRKALEDWDGEPPLHVQKYVMDECRKWNLVWVGRNKVAPLEPDEVEMLLGFPKNHTRGGGISRTDRYKSLGNSFQVDTVAYHLSVLKDMFPGGINMLSLFSGIGGAEVALHRLGIPLKNVVSVEISEVNRNIVRSWWEQTNQRGNLIDIADVQTVNGDRLEQLMNSFGGFDLVVGGSPCNNLAGSNRYSRDGLEGKQSSLFYDYFRILDLVKCVMNRGI